MVETEPRTSDGDRARARVVRKASRAKRDERGVISENVSRTDRQLATFHFESWLVRPYADRGSRLPRRPLFVFARGALVRDRVRALSSDAMATAADVKRAVYARRSYFLENVATLSMKQARRLLEGDLGLEERALDDDKRKAAVAKYVDRVLASGDAKTPSAKPAETARPEKENRKPAVPKRRPEPERRPEPAAAPQRKKSKRDEYSDEDEDEDDADSDEDDDDADSDDESGSDDSGSRKRRTASEPKPKPKPKPAAVTGDVAKLRNLCKRAGLTYQHVFMRHKDDAGREAALIGILAEAGLTRGSDASAVAKVRAKVEREKDLDGIDAKNVIEGGRRRRAATVNQWGQTIDYAALNGKKKRRDGTYADSDDESSSSDESESESDASADEDEVEDEEGPGLGADVAMHPPNVSDEGKVSKIPVKAGSSNNDAAADVEPRDVFFSDDDDTPAKKVPTNVSEPAEEKPKAPRRGGVLYDSDDE